MKSKITIDKLVLIGLVLLNGLFLVYWCVLAYYSRLHYDDLHFLWESREKSLIGFVKYNYLCQSGRFVIYGINWAVSVVSDFFGTFQCWAVLYYFVGLGLSWLAVRDLPFNVSRWGLFLCLCLIYNLYILTNIDFPTFFWPCAMMYYISMPAALLVLRYMNYQRLNWNQWILFVFAVVFIGGTYETFTPMVLLMLLMNGLYYCQSKDWDLKETWLMPQVKRLFLTVVILIILMVIVVAAPGNYVRLSTSIGEGFQHPIGLKGWIGAEIEAISIFFYLLSFYIPYYLVVFALSYSVGCKSPRQIRISKIKTVLVLFFGFVVYLIISAIPNVYLYNSFGIQRTYTHVVLALLMTIAAIGFVSGVGSQPGLAVWGSMVGIMTLVIIMCVNLCFDIPTAKAYAEAVDERVDYLCELRDKGQTETITVAPLPVPYTEDVKHFVMTRLGKDTPKTVLYYISDTDTVPNEYEYHMKRVLNLDFDFVINQKERIDGGKHY